MPRPIDANTLKAEFTGNFKDNYTKSEIHALIDLAPTIGGWTSVKDRLPENKKNVLVCLYDGRRKKVSNYPDGKRITIRIDRIVSDYGEPFWAKGNTPNVIAWMPLPEPPEEES